MKKIFSKIIITTIFAFAIMILSSNYSEAAVTADIWASSSSVEVGKTVTISWSSTGADSCYNNFNSSTATSGDYQYIAGSAGSKTFSVSCRHKVIADVYYQLSSFVSTAGSYQIKAAEGVLQLGDVVAGAVEGNCFYHYRVGGSYNNPSSASILYYWSKTTKPCN